MTKTEAPKVNLSCPIAARLIESWVMADIIDSDEDRVRYAEEIKSHQAGGAYSGCLKCVDAT